MAGGHDDIFDRATVSEGADGTIHYRASSFGYCIGALVRARIGMTPSQPPDYMLERYQEGHNWEREVLARGLGVDWVEVTKDSELQRFGQIIEGRNGERQIETGLSWSNKRVTCHPDAIVQHGSDKHMRVAEVKFLASDTVMRMANNDATDMVSVLGVPYAWQASIEMLTTGLPMLYIVGGKDVKVTKDAREVVGIEDVLIFEWDEPPFSFRDVKMRVAEVEGWAARGEFPPCVVPFDWPCGYWQEHEAREAEELTDDQLMHLVESYDRAVSKRDAHDEEAKRIKADIDARLVEVGVDGGRCNGYDIARTAARKGNVSWSAWAKEVRKKHPEIEVDEDAFRGAEVAAGIRMTKLKEKG